jgi:hypothetical protein
MDWTLEQLQTQDFDNRFTNYRRICELIIVLFFILLYIFLRNSQIPKLDLQFTKFYRQVDWKKYEPDRNRIIKKQQVPAPLNPSTSSNPSYEDLSEIVDLNFLDKNVSSILNQQPEKSLQYIPEKQQIPEYSARFSIDKPDIPISMEQQNEYLKNNLTNLLPQKYVEPQNIGPTVAINNVVVNQNNSGNNKIYPRQDQVAISSEKIIPGPGVIDIPLISKQKVTNAQDISVIIDELLRWIKKHPAEFNKVTQSFMMYEEKDLTSRVIFRHKNRTFELYLLYKEKSKEIRICLIEGTQSTMLIDSGFKKQSNYLRTGNIARGQDNTIFSFGTSQYPASEKTTFDFYQFFLSWWEQAKQEK